MIVCVCHRVSDRDLAREVASGCPSFDDLQDATRVGTACGACLDCAHETWQALRGPGSGPGPGRCGVADRARRPMPAEA